MDSILVDDNDLLMVSQLDPSLKPEHQLDDDHHDTSGPPGNEEESATVHPNSADIHNVFEFQQFIDRHSSEQEEPQDGKAAMAALKMIDLHALEAENQVLDSTSHQDYEDESTDLDASNQASSGSIVHVEYNPNEKTKRLGRPRKHLNGMPSPAPGESASDNLEKAKISKFRFDERPIEGPGSRGGDPHSQRKSKGKLTESSALKKRKQALLNFTKSEDLASLSLVTSEMDLMNEKVVKHDLEVELISSVDDEFLPDLVAEVEKSASSDKLGVLTALNDAQSDVEVLERTSNVEMNGNEGIQSIQKSSIGREIGEPDVSAMVVDSADQTESVDDDSALVKEESLTAVKVLPEETITDTKSPKGSSKRSVKSEGSEPAKKKAKITKEKKPVAKKTKKGETKKATKDSKPRENAKIKKLTLSFKPKVSRTTIIREKNRITRTYPGPLIPIHYDLYDDNLISAESNAATATEKLALGFPVKSCEYLSDIIFLIGYLSKFEHLIDFGPVGPEDIETGLGLRDLEEDVPSRVAPAMEQLFRRLLALVLNRKKPILLSMQRTAIQELRGKYIGLGLPEEWRDDEHIRVVTSLPCDPVKDRVDMAKPEVSSSDNYEYQAPAEKFNPFLEKDFEEFGLLGIEKPIDRLIMLRCLAIWSLSASNQLKTHLTKVINGQDIPGERDTTYGSRAVLKGFNQTTELKKQLELKIAKKSKGQLTPKGTPDPDSISRYIDPTSDPLAHPMALRLNEFLVGDCGFHIGRFYLVRMADATSGGISSIDKMKSVARDPAGVRSSIPSSFKLYVEDVHRMLTDSLAVYGPEFDEAGHEVPTTGKLHQSGYFHVVASNTQELRAFVAHVGARLGLRDSDEIIISLGSLAYKPLLHIYHYLSLILPLLEELEKLEVTGVGEVRTSRKKRVDYAVAKEAEWNDEDEYHEEEYAHVEEGDDDDYYEDGDADADAEEYVE